MFQSVYDYPYLSSSANHIFDLTFGTSDASALAVTNHHLVQCVVTEAKASPFQYVFVPRLNP